MEEREERDAPSLVTEAELRARRERTDEISKIMGQSLLKGHKMLASTCSQCGNIEMKDKSGKVYCVACTEVDAKMKQNPPKNDNDDDEDDKNDKNDKDDDDDKKMDKKVAKETDEEKKKKKKKPVLTDKMTDLIRKNKETRIPVEEPMIVPKRAYVCTMADPTPSNVNVLDDDEDDDDEGNGDYRIEASVRTILVKMNEVKGELDRIHGGRDVEPATKLVVLMKECADCITALKRAQVFLNP